MSVGQALGDETIEAPPEHPRPEFEILDAGPVERAAAPTLRFRTRGATAPVARCSSPHCRC